MDVLCVSSCGVSHEGTNCSLGISILMRVVETGTNNPCVSEHASHHGCQGLLPWGRLLPHAFLEGPASREETGSNTSSLFPKQAVLCELEESTRWAEMMKEASV